MCLCSSKPNDGFFIHDPETGEDSNIALEKLRDVIAQCILPQAGLLTQTPLTELQNCWCDFRQNIFLFGLWMFPCFAGENEDEKLNELMYEAWRINRDCKLLRDGLQGLSWDGQ